MRIATVVVAGLLQARVVAAQPPTARAVPASAEELAIIAAAVDSLYVGRDATHRVVVRSPTDTLTEGATRYYRHLPVPPDLVEDLIRRNSVSADVRDIAELLRTAAPLEFITADSLRGLPRGNPDAHWRAFYESFPGSGGLVEVSRPGIDATGKSALVLIGRGCGGLCGAWGYAILRKNGDRWVVERYVVNRVS